MAPGIKPSNGHQSVPVVTLHHNPVGKMTSGQSRGKTNLAEDRVAPSGYQAGPGMKPMGKC